ncbi:DELTA-thalatoxin-Avl2a-like isoform X2 [Oculina patagonica]
MFDPLVLLTFLTVISKATCDEAPTSQETVELGKALNLRGTNLLSDFQERERSIFESLPSNCFRKDTRNLKSSRFFEYYESNKAFYSSLGTESSLEASVQSAYTLGATLNVATKSKSSETNKVKSCISFAGPTSVGKVGVEACANISKSEIRRASEMSTSDKVFVLGGDPKTRNKLLHKDTRSNELIEQLMNEAGGDSASSVQHTFRAIWDILTSRFDAGSPNHIRAINLENYYLGFLSFGCHSIKGGRVQIQKFDYSSSSTPESPEFECSLAKEGCHSDDDCRYVVGPWCTCRGESCVRYKSVKRDTGDSKKTAYAHRRGNWDWKGCGWKSWTAWTQCSCYNKNRDTREVVWSLPSKDAAASVAPSNGTHHEANNPGQSAAPSNGPHHEAKNPGHSAASSNGTHHEEKNAGYSEAKEKKKEINLPRTVIL